MIYEWDQQRNSPDDVEADVFSGGVALFLNATSFPLLENSSLSLDSTESILLGADCKWPEKRKCDEVKIKSTNSTNSCNSEWNKKFKLN